jgi:hypothetical protein
MKTRIIISLLSVAFLGPAAIAVSFGGVSESNSLNAVRALPSVLQLEPKQSSLAPVDNQNLEVEVITLTESGFDPPVITRQRGLFILALHNRSGERELVFRISGPHSEQVSEVRVRSGRRSQYQRLDLPTGSYNIAEVNHPAWSCTLTITR